MTALAPKAEVKPRSRYVGEVPIAHDRRAAKAHCLARGLRRVREPLSKAARRSWAGGRSRARTHTPRVSRRREFWRRLSRNRSRAHDARSRYRRLRLVED